MDAIVLASVYMSALAISACVVLAFSSSIDEILAGLIPEEMSAAWCRYVKFALFTVSLAGGVRLTEISASVGQRQGPGGPPPIAAGLGLLEVFKTIVGTLAAASGTLLVFFAATLAAHAAMRIYQSYRTAAERAASKRPAIGSERPSGRPERHYAPGGRHSGQEGAQSGSSEIRSDAPAERR